VAIDLRSVTDAEFPAYARAIGTAFGSLPEERTVGDWRAVLPLDRTIAAFERDDIVGTAAAYSFHLTLPGARTEPAAGVTFVGVRPTHRRRGLLTAMMRHQLDDVVRRGEALMVLVASEAPIYGRFGYGAAVFGAAWTVGTDALELALPSRAAGRVRLVDDEEARKVVPAVFDRARTRHVGAVTRSDEVWNNLYASRKKEGALGSSFTVLHEADDGEPDGFARYRIEWGAPEGPLRNTIVVVDLDALDDEIEAALWDYLLHVDLVGSVRATNRPVDEPLRWRLADMRRVEVTRVTDRLWVRVVDPATALAARRYPISDGLVVGLVDRFRPENGGRWRVEGSPDGATCVRTDRSPDLTLGAPELGSLFLGGVSATTLARSARIDEHTPDALTRADAFFCTRPAPWCATQF
jgi:predicted acetyltransferase